MLQSEIFIESAKKEMDIFFEQNMGNGTSMSMVWEASKAFFRRLAISYSAQQKKEKSLKFKLLKEDLKREENKLIMNSSIKQIKVKINYTQQQINLLLAEDLEKEIRFAKLNHFKNANKPGKWLAYRLRKEKGRSWIICLKDETNQIKFVHEDLKKIIKNFYQELYKKRRLT